MLMIVVLSLLLLNFHQLLISSSNLLLKNGYHFLSLFNSVDPIYIVYENPNIY